MVLLYSLVGTTLFDRYRATKCRDIDYKVCFMFRTPEGEVTTLWDGLLGWRAIIWFPRVNDRWKSSSRSGG